MLGITTVVDSYLSEPEVKIMSECFFLVNGSLWSIVYKYGQAIITDTTYSLLQMAVVEVYAGGKKMDSPDSKSQLSPMHCALLIEGISQNTTGGVYVPEVFKRFCCF